MVLAPRTQPPVQATWLLVRATFPAVAPMARLPVASAAGRDTPFPLKPAASRTRKYACAAIEPLLIAVTCQLAPLSVALSYCTAQPLMSTADELRLWSSM